MGKVPASHLGDQGVKYTYEKRALGEKQRRQSRVQGWKDGSLPMVTFSSEPTLQLALGTLKPEGEGLKDKLVRPLGTNRL